MVSSGLGGPDAWGCLDALPENSDCLRLVGWMRVIVILAI